MKQTVAYLRVSTARQGKSGLGLEAQRAAVRRFADDHGFSIASEYVEVETGKGSDALARRPKLAAALDHAHNLGCPVLVAKLCRLGRDVHFISGLMARRVPFIVAELGPDVDPFMLHIYAAMHEQERRLISQRTREALKAAKARGTRLGSPTPEKGARAGARAVSEKAERFAANVLPVIREIQGAGATSLRAVAKTLNTRGIPTARGGKWSPQAVSNVLQRSQDAA